MAHFVVIHHYRHTSQVLHKYEFMADSCSTNTNIILLLLGYNPVKTLYVNIVFPARHI